MSVQNSCIAIEWTKLGEMPKSGSDDELAAFFFEALDAGKSWLHPVQFGGQVDSETFSNWDGLIEFNDWLSECRGTMHGDAFETFVELFTSVGLLYDEETLAPSPIREGVDRESEWMLGAIPPGEVKRLAAVAESIDLNAIEEEFQRALDENPLEVLPDGDTMRRWILALSEGLRATASEGRGIIMGAA